MARGKYLTYPHPQHARGGCKVSWNYYAKREDAEVASKAAAHNAKLDAAQGYDFGYCSPGSIRECKPGEQWKDGWGNDAPMVDVGGLFEVCLP